LQGILAVFNPLEIINGHIHFFKKFQGKITADDSGVAHNILKILQKLFQNFIRTTYMNVLLLHNPSFMSLLSGKARATAPIQPPSPTPSCRQTPQLS
jgi:hypothetical protein